MYVEMAPTSSSQGLATDALLTSHHHPHHHPSPSIALPSTPTLLYEKEKKSQVVPGIAPGLSESGNSKLENIRVSLIRLKSNVLRSDNCYTTRPIDGTIILINNIYKASSFSCLPQSVLQRSFVIGKVSNGSLIPCAP